MARTGVNGASNVVYPATLRAWAVRWGPLRYRRVRRCALTPARLRYGRPAACDIAATRSQCRAPSLGAMDLTLSPDQLALQDRARRFAREVLQPLEVGFETVRWPHRPGRRRQRQGEGDRRPTSRRQLPEGGRRPGLVDARAGPRPRAARAGDGRPLGPHPGRLQRARSIAIPTSAGAISSRASAASATAATRSPRRVPARTPARSKRPPSAMTPRATTCSTARNGSSPGRPTPTS